jgi:hypothetical protein
MTAAVLAHVAEDVARSLSFARVRGGAAFITTASMYPNGAGVVIRLDETGTGYSVSDDGYTAVIAETMHMLPTFRRVASDIGSRLGVRFEGGTFFVDDVPRESLVSIVVAVATAAARSAERVVVAAEQQKARRTRDLFDQRLVEAFGKKVEFDVVVRGGTAREWMFDAALKDGKQLSALFDLVQPAFVAIASENLKILDVRSSEPEASVTVALADYDRTEPSLRSLLSHSADRVIAANDEASRYAQLVSRLH